MKLRTWYLTPEGGVDSYESDAPAEADLERYLQHLGAAIASGGLLSYRENGVYRFSVPASRILKIEWAGS